MTWKIVDGPKYVKLTRKLAQEYAQMERCPDDRDLQESRLEHLRRVIEEGRFRAPDWASAYCKETKTKYRVNGKHTSTIISGLEEIPDVKVSVTEYECDTLHEVASLYATFDARFSARSPGDIYVVYARSVPDLNDVNSSTIKLAAAGMGYGMWENGGGRETSVTNEMRAELLVRHPDFVIWLDGMHVMIKENKFLKRRSVVAAMFLTYLKYKDLSNKFWNLVKTGDAASPNDPTRVLQRYLMTTVVARRAANDKQAASDHEMMVKCIHGFNAWKKGESTALKYHSNKPTPEVA